MDGVIDPTAKAKYPVILGDGLLGKTSNDIFTGIRYNHKPSLSSSSGPDHARLKPARPGSTTDFDLSMTDDAGKFAFEGTRNTEKNQYVLYFDEAREAFILDRIDSTFDMNLTRTPETSDPDKLRRRHPHISSDKLSKTDRPAEGTKKDAKKPTLKADKRSPLVQPKAKPEKKAPRKSDTHVASASKPKPKPPVKARPADPEDEEEEDEDDALLIEYPDGDPKAKKSADFSPAFPSVRRFDDFMDARESEGDDADGETEDEPELLTLPSPIDRSSHHHHHHRQAELESGFQDGGHDAMDLDHEVEETPQEADDNADLDDELGKELENAFDDLQNSNQGTPAANDHDESEISEED